MKTLYFDCFAGASGNMILGGLIALGIDPNNLTCEIERFSPVEFKLQVETVDRSGIAAVHVKVIVPDERKHRHLSDIELMIKGSELSDRIKERSLKIFARLAAAEAKVHGIDVGKIHFHEVGAMDAIIDVIGACIGIDMLRVERFTCSKIHVGSGFVEMAHGKYPVPPPAVAELLSGSPIYSTEIRGELITPTGAAIITALCDSYGTLPEMVVEQSGYGAGTREYDAFPNVLRMMLGESEPGSKGAAGGSFGGTLAESLTLLETNIDDSTPQVLGFVMDRVFEIGALDCWFTPVQMKKSRPAVLISVLCPHELKDAVSEMLYSETTTIGIRSLTVERNSLPRVKVNIETRFGPVSAKIARFNGKVVNVMPEYEDVRRIAHEKNIPFGEVHQAVLVEATKSVAAAGNAK